MRLWRFPVQIVGEVQVFRKVPESSGADALELDAL